MPILVHCRYACPGSPADPAIVSDLINIWFVYCTTPTSIVQPRSTTDQGHLSFKIDGVYLEILLVVVLKLVSIDAGKIPIVDLQ